MICTQCRKEISDKHICPYCGAEHQGDEPFVTLGDLVADDDATSGATDSANKVVAYEPVSEDYFAVLGDIVSGGEGTGEADENYNCAGSSNVADYFRALGDLDETERLQDDLTEDTPVVDEFKPGDELNAAGKAFNIPIKNELLVTQTDLKQPPAFVWKYWMTIAACCAVIVCLAIWWLTSASGSKPDTEQNVKIAETALDVVLQVPVNEVNAEEIETPKFLPTIEERNGYEIISFEKTTDGALATMRVFAPDVYGVANNLDSSNTYTDANALMDALDNALKTAPIVEKQVVIEYILTEEGYAPILTAEFLDAFYGGIYKLRDEAIANAAAEG